MPVLGFGQPVGQIVQTAYVVPDIRAGMEWWLADGRVGPWFLLESFTGPEQRYRGEPTRADVAIAMSFSGHMMIELIQPKDNEPSVYQETIRSRGYGFHHLGLAVADVEAERAAYPEARLSRGILDAGAQWRHRVLHGRWSQCAGIHRTHSCDLWHGRDVHPLLARLGGLGRPRSREAFRMSSLPSLVETSGWPRSSPSLTCESSTVR